MADIDHMVATPLSAATRPRQWPVSRVTLMGDAVHVMPPTGAHGGNTALRDAALLAEELLRVAKGDRSPEQAIRAYQQEMMRYAFKEVARSVRMLRQINVSSPVARFALLRALPWLRSIAVPRSPAG